MNKEEIKNNTPVEISLNSTVVFYSEEAKGDTWGSNEVAYELYYKTKDGLLYISEIGAFGDRTLVKRLQDKRGRGITLKEMLENIEEISQMTYKEFKERILMV